MRTTLHLTDYRCITGDSLTVLIDRQAVNH